MDKRPISSWIRVLFGAIGFAAITITSSAGDTPSLRAGAAVVDITPQEFSMNLPGGFRGNPAEIAHDPLHARALVLDDGATTLAMVVVDNLGVAREAADDARALATERCGIPPEKILVASTHTHSAPSSNVKEGQPAAVAYRKLLIEGIAESIVRAHKALRPAAVGHAVHPLPDEVRNRRWYLKPGKMPLNPFGEMDQVKMNPGTSPEVLDRPAGPIDPDVTILSVRDTKTRKPLALFANYTLHYVGGVPRGQISADYFGEFSRLMPFRLRAGDDFVAMMSNGATGDINNIPFLITRPPREPFEQIRIVARKAADAAWFAWKKIDAHDSDLRLGMIEREITLKMRRPTTEQIERAKTIVATKGEAELAKLPRLAEPYARRTLSLAAGPETLSVPLQTLRIGDFAICAIPFETLVEIGLDLKKRSPFPRTIVLGVTNGYNGYLPTPEQHELGGYETWLGTCRVQEDSSVIITDHLLEMLGELAKEE
ncbi:MAG: neutral/alkaline non-lysosomal ceramidase N-terminal domain-containing protein [Planctomycetes bacterium]|nr:neutral/alkaline non-lysosomal ceramidase N-terminal domain-containing protein [Planctomycetota bacterium]MBL7037010.1 neutral/alkaline non-lysosomal ceramidase N-terminal domain-containing protein [Pirellulaceae bacterium]